MKRIILTVMTLAFSLSSLAEQPQSTAVLVGTSDLLVMTSIEGKNQGIMSSYKSYSQLSQKNRLLKQARIQQQYSQFLEQKRALNSSAVSL
ncbi:MAG: hypothetical protein JKY50_08695 [Oleispira sp.]|nr:hypothetical protein [Oleispira sp.]